MAVSLTPVICAASRLGDAKVVSCVPFGKMVKFLQSFKQECSK